MEDPKRKNDEPLGPAPADRDVFAADDETVLPVDVEGHLRWLETGEGDAWPPERSG